MTENAAPPEPPKESADDKGSGHPHIRWLFILAVVVGIGIALYAVVAGGRSIKSIDFYPPRIEFEEPASPLTPTPTPAPGVQPPSNPGGGSSGGGSSGGDGSESGSSGSGSGNGGSGGSRPAPTVPKSPDEGTKPSPSTNWTERAQVSADIFADKGAATKIGRTEVGVDYRVRCRIGPSSSQPESVRKGGWYRLVDGGYVAANTFENGPLPNENPYDDEVGTC